MEAPDRKSPRLSQRFLALLRQKLPKALAISVFAFALSALLITPLSFSASAFLSNPEKSDFAITDAYTILADSREVSKRDTNIVIVNLRGLDREGISQVLELMPYLDPKAVGLDVVFEAPHEDDSRLIEAARNCPGLVMAESMSKEDDFFRPLEYSFFADSIGVRRGVTTFPARFAKSTIRKIKNFFPEENGDSVPAFVVALAQVGAPEAFDKLSKRGNEFELINYASRNIEVIMPEDIADRAQELKGKIILLGDTDDLLDMHATPANSTVSGVMIHAKALSTILDGDYLNTMSDFMNKAVAFLLCVLIVLIWHMFSDKELLLRGGTVRILQLTLLLSMIIAGYALFVQRNFVWDFSYALLMITFGLFANDIWLFGEYLFVVYPRKRRERRNETESAR